MDAEISGAVDLPLESLPAEPLLTRDYDSRPTLVYEGLRNKYGPVAPVDLLGVPVWLVLGYAEVLDILRDRRGIWSKRLDTWRNRTEGRVPKDWPLMPAFEVNNSVFSDGRKLAELRAAWTEALRPFQDRSQRQARNLEAKVARSADELISVLAEGGARSGFADLSAQYARPLTLMVCDLLLGFEGSQSDDVLMDMWRLLDAGPDAAAAQERLLGALMELVARRRVEPGHDIPSYMMEAQPQLTDEDVVREIVMVTGLVGDYAGTLICNTAAEVITGNAGARANVSFGLIGETINRVATASPPMANLTFRWPTTDVKVGRFTIAAGDPVMLSVAAAHTDPVFADASSPDRVVSSRAHLAWGAGPHHCLGRELATMITTIAVGRLFDRFSMLELALPADQLPWRSSPLMRSLRSLPVRFELSGPIEDRPEPAPAAGQAATGGEDGTPRSAIWRFLRVLRRQGRD